MNTVSAASDDTHDDKPLDPEVEAVRRKLARLLMVSIGIMIIGLMAVLLAIVYKMTNSTEPSAAMGAAVPAAPFTPADDLVLPVPAGARIVSHSLSGSRMTVLLALSGGGSEIRVFDLQTNSTVAVIAVEPQ